MSDSARGDGGGDTPQRPTPAEADTYKAAGGAGGDHQRGREFAASKNPIKITIQVPGPGA